VTICSPVSSTLLAVALLAATVAPAFAQRGGNTATNTLTNTTLAGQTTVSPNNGLDAMVMTTPATDNALYDTQPLAALFVRPPVSPSTRNFAAGIWVVTNGSAMDKGRGIAVQNVGHSDSFYAQLDGSDACGFCSYVFAPAFGAAFGVADPAGVGVYVKELPAGGGANLATYEANEVGASELVRLNAAESGKNGIVFRMGQPGNRAIAVQDISEKTVFSLSADTGRLDAAGYSANGVPGVTASGTSCVITRITNGLITGAKCQ
jgi:hypothetical protein